MKGNEVFTRKNMVTIIICFIMVFVLFTMDLMAKEQSDKIQKDNLTMVSESSLKLSSKEDDILDIYPAIIIRMYSHHTNILEAGAFKSVSFKANSLSDEDICNAVSVYIGMDKDSRIKYSAWLETMKVSSSSYKHIVCELFKSLKKSKLKNFKRIIKCAEKNFYISKEKNHIYHCSFPTDAPPVLTASNKVKYKGKDMILSGDVIDYMSGNRKIGTYRAVFTKKASKYGIHSFKKLTVKKE